jgi:multidrug efflux system membrane fusion protein
LIGDINEPTVIPPDHRIEGHVPVRYRVKRLWIILGILCLLALAAVVAFFIFTHEKNEKKAAAAARPKPAGISITTVTAQKGNIGVHLDSIGTVTPVYTASITSQVTGSVIAVNFKEGQLVQKGDPLVDIDPRPYRATLLQAEGTLEKDENVLAQAQMDYDRYRAAWERNAIAKQILEDQEKLVLQEKGTVKNDQGTVQYDQVQLDFCHITAPISGRIGLRLVDPGNVVQASGSTTLAVITQLQPITVVFTIAEGSLGPVQTRLNAGAKLPVDALDRTAQTKIATGQLLTLDNQIDTTTGTVKGRAEFDNKNNALFPNEFVNTRLLVNTLQGVTLVQSSAIQQNGQASFVYVIENNFAHTRTVTTGVTDGGITQVTGINPGDVLADSSFDKLQDNAAVAVNNNPPNAANNASKKAPAKSKSTGKTSGSKSR